MLSNAAGATKIFKKQHLCNVSKNSVWCAQPQLEINIIYGHLKKIAQSKTICIQTQIAAITKQNIFDGTHYYNVCWLCLQFAVADLKGTQFTWISKHNRELEGRKLGIKGLSRALQIHSMCYKLRQYIA